MAKEIQTQVINGVTWTTEYPKAAGDYGKVLSKSQNTFNDPEWMTVRAGFDGSKNIMCFADGQFMYKSELEEAWFTPIVLPEFPKLLP